jgi:hypothetical protein
MQMGRRWLHSVDLETDENGRPLIESNVAALAAAIKVPTTGTELGRLTLTGHVQRLGMAPAATGDIQNFGSWDQVLGLTEANTDAGRIYVTVGFDDQEVTFYLEAFKDAAREQKIFHVSGINNLGHFPLEADNVSGVIGYVEFLGSGTGTGEVLFTLSRPCRSIFIRPQEPATSGGTNAVAVRVGYSADPTAYVLKPQDSGYLIEWADVCGLYVLGASSDAIYVTVKS